MDSITIVITPNGKSYDIKCDELEIFISATDLVYGLKDFAQRVKTQSDKNKNSWQKSMLPFNLYGKSDTGY